MPLMRTSEMPLNAFLWRADDGQTLNAGFVIFQGIETSIVKIPFL